MNSQAVRHPLQNKITMAITSLVLLLTASSAISTVARPSDDLAQFMGTWSAIHQGTPFFILEFHKDKETLAGGIRVCEFSMVGSGDQPDVTVTNKTLSENLPIRNLAISGKSITFDWKDPDGDENHLIFERVDENTARLKWRDLPKDVSMPTLLLTRRSPENH